MKKIIIFLLCLFSINVYADTCDKNELSRLKKLAGYVEITTSSEIKEKKDNNKVLYKYGEYTLNASNLNDEIKIRVYQDYYANKYKEFNGTNGIGTLKPFYDGEKVTVTIEAYVKNGCSGEKLRTITVKLPYYNVYSENKSCSQDNVFYESKCCQNIVENTFKDSDAFTKCLDDYYENSYIKIVESKDVEKNEGIHSFWIYLIVSIVFVVFLTLSFVVIKKLKKSRI